jgi:ATP-dependent Clp protease adaptor protein ClpS
MQSAWRSNMDVMSDPTPGVGVPVAEPVEKTRHAPRYKVFVHNDDVTPFILVIHVLRGIFGLEAKRAIEVTREAHEEGVAFVVALAFEQAEFRVQQAHALARGAGYPLRFSYEPE